jgi:hypothetical protein
MASEVWPGLAKLGEECCELGQVIMKIVGTAGTMLRMLYGSLLKCRQTVAKGFAQMQLEIDTKEAS